MIRSEYLLHGNPAAAAVVHGVLSHQLRSVVVTAEAATNDSSCFERVDL